MQTMIEPVDSPPLLTIAIPTYNRASYLALCLRRIQEEFDDLTVQKRSMVKIYISNNASTDNTADIIDTFLSNFRGIVETISHPNSIGGENNVTRCYTLAQTPYVWVIGDDDVILQGKLSMVIDVLAKQKIDVLYVNGYSFSEHYLDEPRRGRGQKGIVECDSALSFVKQTHIMLTFLTGLIVRTGVRMDTVQHVIEKTNLSQLGWIFQLVRDGKQFAIIKDRVYAAKIGNSGGYGAINVFGKHLGNIANAIFKDHPKLVRAIQNGTIVTWFPTYIMSLRQGETGYVQENMAVDLKRVFQGNWRYYVFLAPLIVLPITLARLYFLLIRVMRLLFRTILI